MTAPSLPTVRRVATAQLIAAAHLTHPLAQPCSPWWARLARPLRSIR